MCATRFQENAGRPLLFKGQDQSISPKLLNQAVRVLLEKGAVVEAATYLAKLDANQLPLDVSTSSLIVPLFSGKGKLREHIKLLLVKYQPSETFS